jgi:periplasmic protein TonB
MTNPSFPDQLADWNELVFAGRERNYGAYDLRKRYPRHLLIGLGAATLAGALLLIAPWLNQMGITSPPASVMERIVDLTALAAPPSNPSRTVLPTPPPFEPPQFRQLAYQIPDPTPSEALDPTASPTLHHIDSLAAAPNLGLRELSGREGDIFADWTGTGQHKHDIPQVIRETSLPGPGDFRVVEEAPIPVNLADLRKLIGYPQLALNARIEGTVLLRVLVGLDGSYQRHLVVRTDHPILTQAVEQHIDRLTFTPAIQGGKPVYFWVNIPFVFRAID